MTLTLITLGAALAQDSAPAETPPVEPTPPTSPTPAPVIVAPGENRVIALEPEFVQPQDGCEKQDCELLAASNHS